MTDNTMCLYLTQSEIRVVCRALDCYRPPEPEMSARITATLKLSEAFLLASEKCGDGCTGCPTCGRSESTSEDEA